MFEKENCALRYISAAENYRKETRAKRRAHTPVIEPVIHFGRSKASSVELLGHVHDGDHGKIATDHPCWTNEISNAQRVPPEVRLLTGPIYG